MGFVKSPAEVARIRKLFMNPRFLVQSLRVEFETTADFVRSVLPPCLEPVDRPLALATVSRWQSAACGEFDTSCVFVQARHGELVGFYNLTMLVTGDMPVTWGREIWGEVKKTGQMGLYQDGPRFFGYGERNSVRLIELDADLGAELGEGASTFYAFEIKAFPAADGDGLQYDPLLVVLKADCRYTSMREGTGTVALTGSRYDPLDTVPVISSLSSGYVAGESIYSTHEVVQLSDREAYLPYVYGRNYDDLTQYPVAARYRSKS